MPQRKYSKTRTKVAKPTKRITLPIELDRYNQMVTDSTIFRGWLDQMIELYPELFPDNIVAGYLLPDILPPSVKMPEVHLRRIRLRQDNAEGQAQVLTIAPSEVLPYMTGYPMRWRRPCCCGALGYPFGV